MSDADIAIRPLVPADLPAYKQLRDAMLLAHPEAFTSDAKTESRKPPEDFLHRLGSGRGDAAHFLLGAWRGEALVGAIGCERDARPKVRHIGHLVGMMVHADSRGGGVGRGLLDACIGAARRADGIEMLTLSVTAGNVAATRLYEAVGFVTYGRLERAVCLTDGRSFAKLQMVLGLRSPPR